MSDMEQLRTYQLGMEREIWNENSVEEVFFFPRFFSRLDFDILMADLL